MTPLTAEQRSQRLQEIAHQLGAVPNSDAAPVSPPDRPPSFSGPDDERKANTILQTLQIDASQSPTLKKLYKPDKSSKYSYAALYDALLRVVEENGLPGVLEILLKRFLEEGGDISISRRGKKRIIHSSSPTEPGYLLQKATKQRSEGFVQLLAPHGNQAALDDSLRFALQFKDMAIIKLLLQHGEQDNAMFIWLHADHSTRRQHSTLRDSFYRSREPQRYRAPESSTAC